MDFWGQILIYEDCAQAGEERLGRYYLVWRPPLQEFPGPTRLLFLSPPATRLPLAPKAIKTVSNFFSFFLVGPMKILLR
jgi:hypothetical protein